MSDNELFKSSYDEKNMVLTGRIESEKIEKDDSKKIYSLIETSLNTFKDYKDYILDAEKVNDTTIDSFGYLMKTLGIVKRTSGYMILILKEEILQKFMISNPEMFDYYAVFFSSSEALDYILSKR